MLLSVLQSMPRLANKQGFVLHPAPSLLFCTPPQYQGGGGVGGVFSEMCVSLPCPSGTVKLYIVVPSAFSIAPT